MHRAGHRIVVGGADTPAGNAALRWAVAEAGRTDAHVVVLTAIDESAGSESAFESDHEHESRRRKARARAQSWVVGVLGDLDTHVPVLVSTTEGPVELALAGAGSRADLVVLGREDGEEAASHAASLARFCPCPVMMVDPETTEVAELV